MPTRHCIHWNVSILVFVLSLCVLHVALSEDPPLRVYSSRWMECYDKYVTKTEKHLDVTYDNTSATDIISTRLLTQDDTYDLYVIDAFNGLYQIKTKDYYDALNSSISLKRAYDTLYPAFQKLVLTDDGDLACWIMFAQPFVMKADMELLQRLGMTVPQTFTDLIDSCLALMNNENFPWEDYCLIGGEYAFDQRSMLEFYMDYYLITGQRQHGPVNFENDDFMRSVMYIRDHVPYDDPSEGENPVFDIPAAFEHISTEMQFIPEVTPIEKSALETYATVAILNPYSHHKEDAIAFLEWCASNPSPNSYFYKADLSDPVVNPSIVTRKAEVEADLQLLKKSEQTEAVQHQIEEKEQQIGILEQNQYYISEQDIRWYKDNLADRLFVSEGRPIMYDSMLDLYSQQFLEGICSASEFAHACQTHIDMVYLELQ